jgi:hypothetical protein
MHLYRSCLDYPNFCYLQNSNFHNCQGSYDYYNYDAQYFGDVNMFLKSEETDAFMEELMGLSDATSLTLP